MGGACPAGDAEDQEPFPKVVTLVVMLALSAGSRRLRLQ
jgi:hypothetical protein